MMARPLIIIATILVLPLSAHASESKEYCQWDDFNATCGQNEVIMMTSARYGRMRMGRCVPLDYNIGCSADVIDHVGERCSGRFSCVVHIPDHTMAKLQPCRKDLAAYFEASYECLQVAAPMAASDACRRGIHLQQATTGYVASSQTGRSKHGSTQCPWILHAAPGQRFNITLYDFSERGAAVTSSKRRGSQCPVHALFKETGKVDYMRLCGQGPRHKSVYSSNTNYLEIHIVNISRDTASANFLLKYEVFGCPDVGPIPHAWVERHGDSLVVACNHTHHIWHLVCKDAEWVGNFNNCTAGPSAVREEAFSGNREVPLGLLVAIGIGVLVGVALGFVFLIAVFFCRSRKKPSVLKEANGLLGGEVTTTTDSDQQNIYRLVEMMPTRDVICQDCMQIDLAMDAKGIAATKHHVQLDAGEYEYQRPLGRTVATYPTLTHTPQSCHGQAFVATPTDAVERARDNLTSTLQTCDILNDVAGAGRDDWSPEEWRLEDVYQTKSNSFPCSPGALTTFKGPCDQRPNVSGRVTAEGQC